MSLRAQGWLFRFFASGTGADSLSNISQCKLLSPKLFAASCVMLFLCGAGPLPLGSLAHKSFVYPLSGTRVSSDYGPRHHPVLGFSRHHAGVDLAAPEGAPVRAITDGIVAFAERRGGYGNLIVLVHAGDLTSRYGHLSKISVKPGMRIKAGQLIGRVGSTGISSGPHLHLEIRVNGVARDPELIIPGLAAAGQG